jgi:hypothetical protein
MKQFKGERFRNDGSATTPYVLYLEAKLTRDMRSATRSCVDTLREETGVELTAEDVDLLVGWTRGSFEDVVYLLTVKALTVAQAAAHLKAEAQKRYLILRRGLRGS